jgi:hypothetical protein
MIDSTELTINEMISLIDSKIVYEKVNEHTTHMDLQLLEKTVFY